jgi:hypothetical protein
MLLNTEFDAAWSSMLRSSAEVAVVELIGSTDLGRGPDRRMERGRNGRCEYKRGRRDGGRDPYRERVRTAWWRARSVLRAGARNEQTPQSELAMLTGSIPRANDAGGVRPSG